MADAETLQIAVDSDVVVAAADIPRKLVDALRRQLRPHDALRALSDDQLIQPLLRLLASDGGKVRMPQALLPRLLDACQRHGIRYTIEDRRKMVACAPLRSRLQLDKRRRDALRRLLLRDDGVLVAPSHADRVALAAELIACRQQRTLVLVHGEREVTAWREQLSEALTPPSVATLDAREDQRVVICDYARALDAQSEALRDGFGMVVFDGLADVDALTLARAVRTTHARYMLGLASAPSRADQLHGALYLMLGGVLDRLADPSARPAPALRLAFRRRISAFSHPYSGRADYQAVLAALAGDDSRNRQIAGDIAAEVEAGHACLVLSQRRDHLQRLIEALPAEVESCARALTSDVRPAQRARIAARFDSGELNVLLTTAQLATESLETPRPSRLFLSFPFSYARKLERLVELLLQPAGGKRDAIVYDYDDIAVAPLHRACEKRARVIARLQRAADERYAQWAQLRMDI